MTYEPGQWRCDQCGRRGPHVHDASRPAGWLPVTVYTDGTRLDFCGLTCRLPEAISEIDAAMAALLLV